MKNIQEGNDVEDQCLGLERIGWKIPARLAGVSEHNLSMWDLGLEEDNEDLEELI